MYLSKPNSFTLHHHHTITPSHHHTITPPATTTTTTTTTTLPTHRLPPAAKPRGGGVVSYPSKVQFLDPFLEIRGPYKKYVKIRMFWHHTLSKKLKQFITKWTKIGHFVRVFGEFKIVEFVIPWGLRSIACLWSLILSLFVVAGHSLEVAWLLWCQPVLA